MKMKRSLGGKTLGTPTPTWLVGTYDAQGKPNIATIAWGGICCSEPPAVTVSLRKSRWTYAAIVERKAFTVNVPSEVFAAEADYAGLVSGKDTDKFAVAGLTPVRGEHVDAPYVDEFPLILECRLLHTFDLGIHTQFIGEIVDVKADAEVIAENGLPTAEKILPIVYDPGSRDYFALGQNLGRGFSIGKDVMKRKDGEDGQ